MGDGSVPIIKNSTNSWRGCILLSLIATTLFFIAFAIPHQIFAEFSDTASGVCGEIGAGLWEYCTKACSDNEWQCGGWVEEGDFLTISRALQVCAALFSVIGLFLIAFSRVCRQRPSVMLMAALIFLLTAVACGAGIANFMVQEGDSIDGDFGWMASCKWRLGWAGGLNVAATVIFALNVGFCLVHWKYSKMLVAYEQV